MAGREEPAQDPKRFLRAGAVGFTSVAAALAFGRVFTGSATTWRLVAATALCVGLAEATRRLNIFLAMAVSAAALFLVAAEMILQASTSHGIPTAHTFSAISNAVSLFAEQARTQPAPTYPFDPLVLAAMTAVWAAAFASHSLHVRAGSPLFALVPSVALIGFADAVMPDGARPIYGVLFLSGATAMVFADSLRRFARWGPVKPWSGRRRRASGTGARRIGAFVVAAALVAPGLLPWYRSDPVWKARGGVGVGAPAPLASFDTTLPEASATPLYRVTSPVATYLRLLVLDRFDGRAWWPSASTPSTPGPLAVWPASWGTSSLSGPRITVGISVLEASSPFMPTVLSPLSLYPLPKDAVLDAASATARAPSDLPAGFHYTDTSELAVPTPAQLDSAPDARTAYADASFYPTYTQLPGGIPASVYALTRTIVRGQPDEYRQMLAIQDYLRTFSYSTTSVSPAKANPVAYFLEVSKAGFCQQFAGAMALMARILGYPARVAVGYLPGTKSGSDTYTVTAEQAHTWPEILFPGYGWVAFEPTPTRTNPTAQSYLAPPPVVGRTQGPSPGIHQPAAKTGANPHSGKRGIRGNVSSARPLPARRSKHFDPLPILAALALAFLVLFPLGRGILRRVPKGRGPRRAVISAYRRFELRAADVGLGRRPGETPREHEERLSRAVNFSDGHLGRIVGAVSDAAWSPREPTAADASAARREAVIAARDVIRSVPLVKRAKGWYRVGI